MRTQTSILAFAASERGAITVDWTVLVSAATGCALLLVASLSGTLGSVSAEVNHELFELQADEGADGFDFGAEGWDGAEATFVDGFGYVLGPIGGSGGLQSVSQTFELPPELAQVSVTFDTLAFDSLDGEDFVIYVDGHEIGRITAGYEITYAATPVEGIDISIDFDVSLLSERENLGGQRDAANAEEWWWYDSAAAVTITMDDPNEQITVGFGSTADQDIADESWGVDNFGLKGKRYVTREEAEPEPVLVSEVADTSTGIDGGNGKDKQKGNNGWGNGDQSAPGNSGGNNNAENSDNCHHIHGCGNSN